MQKFSVNQVDLGVSDFDENLGAMWSDHCIRPIVTASINERGEVILIGKMGEFRGKATIELLSIMGEEC